VNFDSLNDQAVTVREHDSMQEVRIGIGAQGYLGRTARGLLTAPGLTAASRRCSGVRAANRFTLN
jgi:hypothetical protein